MYQGFGLLFWGLVVLYSPKSSAQSMCTSLFSVHQNSAPMILAKDQSALQKLQFAIERYGRAETSQDISAATYFLAEIANETMDHIVDNLLILNQANVPDDVSRAYMQSTEQLFAYLAQSTNVGSEYLSIAVNRRMAIDIAILQKEQQRSIDRSRNIGFVHFEENGTGESSTATYRIGFYDGPLQEREVVTKEEGISSRARPQGMMAANLNSGPIGFRYSRTVAFSLTKQPIGFIHFPSVDEIIPSFVLNINNGLFEVSSNKPRVGY